MRNKKGMTMVEIIVAFAVLLLGLAMLTTSLSLAAKIQVRAGAVRETISDAEQRLYADEAVTTDAQTAALTFQPESGNPLPGFTISAVVSEEQAGGYAFPKIEAN